MQVYDMIRGGIDVAYLLNYFLLVIYIKSYIKLTKNYLQRISLVDHCF